MLLSRIVLVRQTGEELPSTSSVNGSLVEVVMRSILPPGHHILSAQEVAERMEACLQEGVGAVWPSWTVSRVSLEVQSPSATHEVSSIRRTSLCIWLRIRVLFIYI